MSSQLAPTDLDFQSVKCFYLYKFVFLSAEHSFDDPEVIMNILPPGMSTGHVLDETVVRVRGLPWQVSDHDVASFFKGLNITRGGVALCLNLKGRRNGEALVRFETAEHRDLAMKRHKHHLSGRYIEVYKGNRQDFIKIARGPVGAMNVAASFLSLGGDVIIRMRGLPYTATAKDIVAFFGKDLSIQNGESGVLLVDHPDGTSTGDAFVIFSDENDAKVALKKHRGKIGQRYVELFRSTQAELQQSTNLTPVRFVWQVISCNRCLKLGNDDNNMLLLAGSYNLYQAVPYYEVLGREVVLANTLQESTMYQLFIPKSSGCQKKGKK
eukprot:gene1143-15490_t